MIDGQIETGKRYTEPDFNKIIEIKEREAYRVKLFGKWRKGRSLRPLMAGISASYFALRAGSLMAFGSIPGGNPVSCGGETSNNGTGPYATGFENRPASLELSLCQYYYEMAGGGSVYENFCSGQCTATTAAKGFVSFKVPKRVTPTITLNGAASLWAASNSTGTQVAGTAIASNYPTPRGFELDITVASGLTAGYATNIRANNSTAQSWVANAEI